MPRSYPQSLPPAVVLLLGVLLAACGEDGPPPAASIEATGELAQTGTVGELVAVAPAVLVEDGAGNPLPGARVAFSVTAGGGEVNVTAIETNMAGRASSGSWTLGSSAGEQVVEAKVGRLAALRFTAQAAPGPPASVTPVQGDGQIGLVDEVLPVIPVVTVQDGFGNPSEGTFVRFEVTVGDGSVSAPDATVGPDGRAAPTQWRLGQTAGPNVVTALVSGVAPAQFTATGEGGPAADANVFAGDNLSAKAGFDVPIPPTVHVGDRFGNPVDGATVVFEVESGGGSITGDTTVTGQNGQAAAGAWTLGPAEGPQSVIATVDSVPGDTVRFSAFATGFDIEIRFLSGVTPTQQQAFELARSRWAAAVVANLPAITLADAPCSGNVLNETVDDLLILAEVVEIDGPGGILGQAGPCLIRTSSGLPIAGIMSFDAADLAALEGAGLLDEVIVHEMGHVLGLGTLQWEPPLLMGRGTDDPFFTGADARTAFDDVGGASYTGTPVPVANTGGEGTRDAHWRESVFDNELMTGFLDAGVNPLSVVSIASMEDLGYVVYLGAADDYILPPPGVAAARAAAGTKFRLREAPMPPPRRVDPDGTVRP